VRCQVDRLYTRMIAVALFERTLIIGISNAERLGSDDIAHLNYGSYLIPEYLRQN
jgi:hypothetical protein